MNDFPRIAVSDRFGTVSIVWNDARYHPMGDILMHSWTLGALVSASGLVRLNADTGGLHILPALRTADSQGLLDVSWYERATPATTLTNVEEASGVMPRTTVSPTSSVLITNVASDWSTVSSDIDPNFGDYTDNALIATGVAPYVGQTLAVAWSDGRSRRAAGVLRQALARAARRVRRQPEAGSPRRTQHIGAAGARRSSNAPGPSASAIPRSRCRLRPQTSGANSQTSAWNGQSTRAISPASRQGRNPRRRSSSKAAVRRSSTPAPCGKAARMLRPRARPCSRGVRHRVGHGLVARGRLGDGARQDLRRQRVLARQAHGKVALRTPVELGRPTRPGSLPGPEPTELDLQHAGGDEAVEVEGGRRAAHADRGSRLLAPNRRALVGDVPVEPATGRVAQRGDAGDGGVKLGVLPAT